MSIEIQFLGGAGGVTGSQFLVTVGGRRILVDCGMFQGSPDEIARNRMPFAFDPDSLDAALLTHAHLDHCGRLPALVGAGFRGPLHATHASADLAEIVLRDSARLQVQFAERWRRHHPDEQARPAEKGLEVESDDPGLQERLRKAPPEGRTETREALYTEAEVDQLLRQAAGVDYGVEVAILDGVTAVFHDAGHILGSAIIELRVRDGAESSTIVFSGDLGRSDTPIIRDPARLVHADYVLVESTYGDREHGPAERTIEELVTAINEVAESDGVLLVPAFAIGRTQELVWILDQLARDGRIPRLPVYIDSPMASRATRIYHKHPEIYDDETSRLVTSGDSPLEYPDQQFTDTVEASKAIRHANRPFVVVASSGMLTGGRIMHHLKDFLPEPSTMLLFIGYQAQGTLGRHLQNGGKSARVDGKEYPVNCRVRSISGFSAHADRYEIEAWLDRFRRSGEAGGRPKSAFLVHGDPDAAEALQRQIRARLGMEAHVPQHRDRVTLPA